MNKKLNVKNIYNIYVIILMGLPIIPEILDFGFYSLKETVFVISTIVTAGILLFATLKGRKFNITTLDIIAMIYLLFVIVATILAKYGVINAMLGTNGRGEGAILILIYIITFAIFSKGYEYVKWGLKFGIIVAGIVSIYSAIEVMLPETYASPFMFRNINNVAYSLCQKENVAITTMVNQNFLSSYICIFLPMLSFNYIHTGRKGVFCLVLMLFLAQVFSVTLGGYITFIFMYLIIIVYSLIMAKNKEQVLLRIILLTLVMILLFIFVNYINDGIYMNEFLGISKEVDNLMALDNKFGTNRMNIWKKCILIICKYPLFGVGPDSLKNEIYQKEYQFVSKSIIDKAHSEPLQIAVSTGIPTMLIYIIFVGIIGVQLLRICLESIKNKKISKKYTIYIHMILISIASYFIQSMINISVIQVFPIYVAMLGYSAGIIYSYKKHKRNKREHSHLFMSKT